MEKECKLLKVDEFKSKTGSPYYLGSFCDEDGQTFKVFLSKDFYDYLKGFSPFTTVVLDFEFSIYKENLSLKLASVH